MNRLSAILVPGDIAVDVAAAGTRAVFDEAGPLFERRHGMSASAVVETLLARERLGSTGLGRGVAIPHGRVKGLKQSAAAVMRLRTGIAFDAPDGEPVVLLVFLLGPEAATLAHREVLAEIAGMLSDRTCLATLMASRDAHALHQAIASWSPVAEKVAR